MATGEESARDTFPKTKDGSTGDVVAWSRQVEDRARRLLASGGVDAERSEAIRNTLAQIEADRTNGESARESTMQLQQLLDPRVDPGPD